jgi:hypothetical protein
MYAWETAEKPKKETINNGSGAGEREPVKRQA